MKNNNDDLSPQDIAQMGASSLQNFKALNDFAKSCAITISGVYSYIAIGALNIHKLDNYRIMFTPVTPAQAAKALNVSPKKIGRWLIILTERGLLMRDQGGCYKVADLNTWLDVSKLVGMNAPNKVLSENDRTAISEFQSAKIAFLMRQIANRIPQRGITTGLAPV
jgi:hypothetical protein